jgi:hypothetical protein
LFEKYNLGGPIVNPEKGDLVSEAGTAYKTSSGKYNVVAPGIMKMDVSEDEARSFLGLDKEGHAAGATFTRGGLFHGRVHSPEEIIPQAVASRGPGPISRALDVLDSVMSGRPIAAGAGGEVHIHMAPHKYDFSGMEISSDMDVERLIKRIVKESTGASVEAVKNKVTNRRT